ncbi:DUF7674 family protein [Streptomyces sp. bgisy154]|uniref:DUF7674 family protein n=1 Tax=Streptomyces sp. bgisy154 TaxID=3413794 RepID=UPI003D7210B3
MPTPDWFRHLLAVSDVLADRDRAEITSWRGGADDTADEDDVPPLSLRLAALATAFAERSAELTPERTAEMFRILEEVQRSGGEYDRTAVATGFFEALLNAWDEGFALQAVWAYMGPESRAHCLAWNRFAGIDSPDWMR